MANKTDRTKLLTQVFAARMPQLEAAVAANEAVTEAGEAVTRAEQHLAEAVELYRQAYVDAAEAGWTDVDLNAVGLTKPKRATAKPSRPASASETAGANNGSQPAETVI